MESIKMYKGRRHVDGAFLQMALKMQEHDMENLSLFTILKGGVYTAHNVFKNLRWSKDNPPIFGYLGLSSYKNDINSSGEVKITYDFDLNEDMIKDKNIWVIDDICDTGRTLDFAKGIIKAYHPKTFRTVVLIDREKRRERNHHPEPDVIGFVYTGKEFLVGAGLGYGEKYRYLRELYELILE